MTPLRNFNDVQMTVIWEFVAPTSLLLHWPPQTHLTPLLTIVVVVLSNYRCQMTSFIGWPSMKLVVSVSSQHLVNVIQHHHVIIHQIVRLILKSKSLHYHYRIMVDRFHFNSWMKSLSLNDFSNQNLNSSQLIFEVINSKLSFLLNGSARKGWYGVERHKKI